MFILYSLTPYFTQTGYSQTKEYREYIDGNIPKTWGKLVTVYIKPGQLDGTKDHEMMVFQADDGTIRVIRFDEVRQDKPEVTVYKRN